MTPKNSIHEAVTAALLTKLAAHKNQQLNKTICFQIYNDIYGTILEIVQTADLKLCNEGINFLAQAYYDSVMINNNQPLDPDIFTQRAMTINIPTEELALMCAMTNGTDIALELAAVIKHRN